MFAEECSLAHWGCCLGKFYRVVCGGGGGGGGIVRGALLNLEK